MKHAIRKLSETVFIVVVALGVLSLIGVIQAVQNALARLIH